MVAKPTTPASKEMNHQNCHLCSLCLSDSELLLLDDVGEGCADHTAEERQAIFFIARTCWYTTPNTGWCASFSRSDGQACSMLYCWPTPSSDRHLNASVESGSWGSSSSSRTLSTWISPSPSTLERFCGVRLMRIIQQFPNTLHLDITITIDTRTLLWSQAHEDHPAVPEHSPLGYHHHHRHSNASVESGSWGSSSSSRTLSTWISPSPSTLERFCGVRLMRIIQQFPNTLHLDITTSRVLRGALQTSSWSVSAFTKAKKTLTRPGKLRSSLRAEPCELYHL